MMQMKRVLSRGALGLLAIVVAATAMTASTAVDAEAQPFACSAAADVKPVFCKGGLPAACNPAAMEEGMPVSTAAALAATDAHMAVLSHPWRCVSSGIVESTLKLRGVPNRHRSEPPRGGHQPGKPHHTRHFPRP